MHHNTHQLPSCYLGVALQFKPQTPKYIYTPSTQFNHVNHPDPTLLVPFTVEAILVIRKLQRKLSLCFTAKKNSFTSRLMINGCSMQPIRVNIKKFKQTMEHDQAIITSEPVFIYLSIN